MLAADFTFYCGAGLFSLLYARQGFCFVMSVGLGYARRFNRPTAYLTTTLPLRLVRAPPSSKRAVSITVARVNNGLRVYPRRL